MAANVDSSETPVGTDSNQNSTPSTQEATMEVKTRRKSEDIAHSSVKEEKKKIKCMFCNDIFAGGGIHRFKEHLAKYPDPPSATLAARELLRTQGTSRPEAPVTLLCPPAIVVKVDGHGGHVISPVVACLQMKPNLL
ncbi:uncharacterized protein LOC110436476 [Sorghum bicolor]|uniref:uncharacterized protein LOC110436476 n=1 Tax=Sorghum bicolor TaxID=4558 RepID=UPI000B425E31|nr:uncharacterized protein LOC110436476 [Sorghum bicolor]|eukprot:XP_021319252.1 uncharacterized protein LOC110436476 [Sorghum bicolor]